MIEDCTAVLLAGGKSKRMGQDKTTLMLDGRSLLQHTFSRVSPLFSETFVSVHDAKEDMPCAQILDQATTESPMAGIAAALQACTSAWVLIVAADMPFVSADLLH
ncbi:MAG: molybdenum cofactor guanylyltransferase, partial [Mariprofundaceae bacterium]|nr:molybdenum cofactor guanylyltransferase [Mariprofundaceae bacterium]